VSEYLQYLGVLGLVLIALGWIPETWEIIKKKKNNLNFKFNLLYAVGSLSLLLYAIYIKDIIFILLNGFAFLMSGIGLIYKFKNLRKLIS
tara:strand:+ start:15541 stop:15810 length:270 start_codon:yes stop_codon:yes gene_type:complete